MNSTANRIGTWDDARDTAFFSATNKLFSQQFMYGAGVLLGSYDDNDLAAPDPGRWVGLGSERSDVAAWTS